MQSNEDQGRSALESLCELTSAHPEVWKSTSSQLLNVVAQVVSKKDFDDGTRASAIEVALALAEQMPASLRKAPETKSMLVPAITQMLLEVEEDDETWEETVEDKDRLATDPVSTAASSLSRLTADLGEKTTLLCCQPIIGELIASGDSWIKRQAGF